MILIAITDDCDDDNDIDDDSDNDNNNIMNILSINIIVLSCKVISYK